MELNTFKQKVMSIFQKYKYAGIVFLIGMVFMLVPVSKMNTDKDNQPTKEMEQQESVEEQLENVLSFIQGAGNVKVMLKEAYGEEIIYQINEDSSISDSATDLKKDVITVTDQNRNETGLIKQINPPKYAGAIILCQGGDNPTVKLAIIDAVSKITGLGSDKIAVLKMK